MTDPSPTDARLAEALRDNLRRRKARMRAAHGERTAGEHAPLETFGADEEGDVPPPEGGTREGAWVREGSKKL